MTQKEKRPHTHQRLGPSVDRPVKSKSELNDKISLDDGDVKMPFIGRTLEGLFFLEEE